MRVGDWGKGYGEGDEWRGLRSREHGEGTVGKEMRRGVD